MQSKISMQSMLLLRGLRPTPVKIRPSERMFLEEIKTVNNDMQLAKLHIIIIFFIVNFHTSAVGTHPIE